MFCGENKLTQQRIFLHPQYLQCGQKIPKVFSFFFCKRTNKFKYSRIQPLKTFKTITWPLRKWSSHFWMLLFCKKSWELENVVIGQSSFKCLGLSHREVRSAKGVHYVNCKKILIMIRKILKLSTRLNISFKLAKELRLTHEQKNVSGTRAFPR